MGASQSTVGEAINAPRTCGVGCFEVRDVRLGDDHNPSRNAGGDHLLGKKFDGRGHFLSYPGITIACAIPALSGPYKLATAISKSGLGRMMLPVPASAYHINVLDVCAKEMLGLSDEGWWQYCSSPQWENAAREVRFARFAPRLTVDRVVLRSAGILVLFKTNDIMDGTPAQPCDVPVGRRLSAQLGVKANAHPWHMIVAYCTDHEAFSKLAPDKLEAYRAKIEEAAKAAFPGSVPMEEARLCRYEDMTAFPPWDGK